METTKIEIDISKQEIQEAVVRSVKESFTSSYNNPIRDAIKKELETVDNTISVMVRDVLTNAIVDEKFKYIEEDLAKANQAINIYQPKLIENKRYGKVTSPIYER